jgi:RHS repeat-associated protein
LIAVRQNQKPNVTASFSKMLVSQLTRTHADGKPVAGQQFDYAFDTIGNRTRTLSGGDTNGANLRLANYYANSLNQITNRDVPGTNDVVGVSWVTNSVNVNGTPANRKGEYFRGTVGANNTNSALWLTTIVTNLSTGINVTGNVYVAQQPEVFQYDADGNLTSDGHWNYTWDAENRLVMMTVSNNTVGPQYQLTFAYDYQGRRIQKIVATNGAAWSTNKFLYDGWNLVAELKPDNSKIRTYVWGSDLSGSMQGAGGVGGLLEVSYYGTGTTNCFPAFDGNGNVAALINAADGTIVANYAYGPFGELIQKTGIMANNIPLRFSTKYQDDESDLLYYGYRYYKPSTGSWPNKDPLGDQGGLNLYNFVANNPINDYDVLGEWNQDVHQLLTTLWSVEAGIAPRYAIELSDADEGVDSISGGKSFLPPPLGEQGRHLKDTIGGIDSRDYYYHDEFTRATNYLKKADKTQDASYCSQAAKAFGRGMHSKQDKSAHRPWPTGQDWTSAGPLIAHPGWWDAYNDGDLTAHYPNDETTWHRVWFLWRHERYLYDKWEGFGTDIGQLQYQSQLKARAEVQNDSRTAISDFVNEIGKSCECRNKMLGTQ